MQLELKMEEIIPPLIFALEAKMKVAMWVRFIRKSIRVTESGAEIFFRES
jgi:hypothetical protein